MAYVINLDEYSDMGTLILVCLHALNNNVIYFDSFGVYHIPKEIKHFIDNKNIQTNIYSIQAYDSVMCGYFYIGFTAFMLKGKSLTDKQFHKKWWYNFKLSKKWVKHLICIQI